MTANPLIQLKEAGQSPWLDNLSRELIESGRLRQMVEGEGLCGVTSNPTIFQKAMSSSDRYDEALGRLLDLGLRREEDLFMALSLQDVADAADLLRPVYESSGGADGFVSIEVAPDLAYDTDRTIEEARRLFSSLNRDNVMIKVPATLPGLAAIEKLVAAGVNVNVTLLFSVNRYAEVVEAYLAGLEKRLKEGKEVDRILSVASFFVSRVDSLVDRLLDEQAAASSSEKVKKHLKGLRGEAAVANARLAYLKLTELFGSARFRVLQGKGAKVQRLLWGSTGTKNPEYSNIKYVQELIGRDTVNTMPEETMMAFKEKGEVRFTIGEDIEQAHSLPNRLGEVGIELQRITDRLESEGVAKFIASYDQVLSETASKRDRLLDDRQ